MDMYFSLTLYHTLCVVLHKLNFNRNTDSVLFLSSSSVNSQVLKTNLEKLNIFKRIYILNESFPNPNQIKCDDDIEYVRLLIDSYVDMFEKNVPCSLLNFETRYICADHFPLGIYLNRKGLSYNYFEDGCGQMSRVEETIQTMNVPHLKTIVEQLKLFGRNDNVQKRYINLSFQKEGYVPSEKDVDFPVAKLLDQLEQTQKRTIKTTFGVPDINITDAEQSVLFCPQHNVNLGVFTVEQQIYQTALLLDYFADGANVYIKPHPNDVYTNYNELGKRVNMIQGSFPSELLPVCVEGKFQKGITAWSTSIYSLGAILRKTVSFTSDIDKDFYKLHRYYAACQMLNTIVTKKTMVYTFGTNNAILKNMLVEVKRCNKCSALIETIAVDFDRTAEFDFGSEPCGILIDDLTGYDVRIVDEIREKIFNLNAEFIIFINSKGDCVFFDGVNYEIFGQMTRWVIQKTLLYEPEIFSEIDNREEDIWIYMKNSKQQETISRLSYIKDLPYSKMMIRTNMAGDDFTAPPADVLYRNIKMLEGILTATEQRVLSEIEKNKTLEAEAEEFHNKVEELSEKLKEYKGAMSEIESLKLEEEVLRSELDLLEQRNINEELKRKIYELKREQSHADN